MSRPQDRAVAAATLALADTEPFPLEPPARDTLGKLLLDLGVGAALGLGIVFMTFWLLVGTL